MAQTFDLSHAPFDRLSPAEAEVVRAAVDIGYFRPGETILARDVAPESLFVVIKGCARFWFAPVEAAQPRSVGSRKQTAPPRAPSTIVRK